MCLSDNIPTQQKQDLAPDMFLYSVCKTSLCLSHHLQQVTWTQQLQYTAHIH